MLKIKSTLPSVHLSDHSLSIFIGSIGRNGCWFSKELVTIQVLVQIRCLVHESLSILMIRIKKEGSKTFQIYFQGADVLYQKERVQDLSIKQIMRIFH